MVRVWLTLALMATSLLLLAQGMPVVSGPAALLMVAAMGALLGSVIVPLRLPERWERAAVSLALVFVALVLGGLALSTAGLLLNGRNWLGLIVLIVAVCGVIALRERAGPAARQRSIPGGVWLLAGLAATQAAVAAGLSVAGALTAPQTPFTQLTLSQPVGGAVIVGLTNHEGSDETYAVVVRVDGAETASWPAVTVPRGERWTGRVTLPSTWQNVTAQVSRSREAAVPSLQTTIWNRNLE
ncbi:MAG: hypothetical protein KatS3mg060_2802 [Dehalococcoidia bacterium]|nr:MAG: hypothetical protein KatS3mg060_2802 [Dehalococcoidia bacterium]